MTDHPDRSKTDGVVIARLRSALDELTAGAGERTVLDPDATIPVRPVRQGRRYRWLVPTLAAAALIAVLVGVALRPEQHTTTPTASIPETPAPQPTIPWYELVLPGYTPTDAVAVEPTYTPATVYLDATYSRMLVVSVMSTTNKLPLSPDATRIKGMQSGEAWVVDDGTGAPTLYWFTAAQTVTVSAVGFDDAGLTTLAPLLELRTEAGMPVVDVPMSSMEPLVEAGQPGAVLYSQWYGAPDPENMSFGEIFVGGPGPGPALSLAAVGSTKISPFDTPFGSGFRLAVGDFAYVSWPIEGTDYWATLSATNDQIDQMLASVRHVEPILPPGPAIVDEAQVPATIAVPLPSAGAEPPAPATDDVVSATEYSDYSLDVDGATVTTEFINVVVPAPYIVDIDDSYTRVVAIDVTDKPSAGLPTEAAPIESILDGKAWLVSQAGPGGKPVPRQVYWTSQDGLTVIASAYGLTPDELTRLAVGFRSAGDKGVESAEYGVLPVIDGSMLADAIRLDTYTWPDGTMATLSYSRLGIDWAVGAEAAFADRIEVARTPFGVGARITAGDRTAIWWTDDSGFAVGLTAATDQIDRLLPVVQGS